MGAIRFSHSQHKPNALLSLSQDSRRKISLCAVCAPDANSTPLQMIILIPGRARIKAFNALKLFAQVERKHSALNVRICELARILICIELYPHKLLRARRRRKWLT